MQRSGRDVRGRRHCTLRMEGGCCCAVALAGRCLTGEGFPWCLTCNEGTCRLRRPERVESSNPIAVYCVPRLPRTNMYITWFGYFYQAARRIASNVTDKVRRMLQPLSLAVLLLLARNTHSSKSGVDNDTQQKTTAMGKAVPSSLQSVLAHPKGVSILVEAALLQMKKAQLNDWALSAVRHATRGQDGLPHEVEVRQWRQTTGRRVPKYGSQDMLRQ